MIPVLANVHDLFSAMIVYRVCAINLTDIRTKWEVYTEVCIVLIFVYFQVSFSFGSMDELLEYILLEENRTDIAALAYLSTGLLPGLSAMEQSNE